MVPRESGGCMITAFITELFKTTVIGSLAWMLLLFLKPLTQKLFSQTWHYYTGLIPSFFMLGITQVIATTISIIYSLVQYSAIHALTFV